MVAQATLDGDEATIDSIIADRQDLLGHRSSRITTHYSVAELSKFIEAAKAHCGIGAAKLPQSFVTCRECLVSD